MIPKALLRGLLLFLVGLSACSPPQGKDERQVPKAQTPLEVGTATASRWVVILDAGHGNPPLDDIDCPNGDDARASLERALNERLLEAAAERLDSLRQRDAFGRDYYEVVDYETAVEPAIATSEGVPVSSIRRRSCGSGDTQIYGGSGWRGYAMRWWARERGSLSYRTVTMQIHNDSRHIGERLGSEAFFIGDPSFRSAARAAMEQVAQPWLGDLDTADERGGFVRGAAGWALHQGQVVFENQLPNNDPRRDNVEEYGSGLHSAVLLEVAHYNGNGEILYANDNLFENPSDFISSAGAALGEQIHIYIMTRTPRLSVPNTQLAPEDVLQIQGAGFSSQGHVTCSISSRCGVLEVGVEANNRGIFDTSLPIDRTGCQGEHSLFCTDELSSIDTEPLAIAVAGAGAQGPQVSVLPPRGVRGRDTFNQDGIHFSPNSEAQCFGSRAGEQPVAFAIDVDERGGFRIRYQPGLDKPAGRYEFWCRDEDGRASNRAEFTILAEAPNAPRCGDGTCDPGEEPRNCQEDCPCVGDRPGDEGWGVVNAEGRIYAVEGDCAHYINFPRNVVALGKAEVRVSRDNFAACFPDSECRSIDGEDDPLLKRPGNAAVYRYREGQLRAFFQQPSYDACSGEDGFSRVFEHATQALFDSLGGVVEPPYCNPGTEQACDGDGVRLCGQDCEWGACSLTCSCNDGDGDGYYPLACDDSDCALRTDCNDNNANINPGVAEVCGNQVDENCDGASQQCPPACSCSDVDGDGYYPLACDDSDCALRTDCNDNNANINPGVAEVCGNQVDENCDGASQQCPPACSCSDVDGDGYYPLACNDGDCALRTDCNDNNANINPGRAEVCGNQVDENCDGASQQCPPACGCNDVDGDGFYPSACNDLDCAQRTDCNDNNANVNPGRAEVCGNQVDENCDGASQQCPPACGCNDVDGDGFYPSACNDLDCAQRTDCNDNNANVNPGRAEVCGNGVDEDCNGADLACVPPNSVRFSVRAANPGPDEVICLSVMRPAMGPMVTRTDGGTHYLDIQVQAGTDVEFVFYASGGGGCNQWRRDLWPTGFQIVVGGVDVNLCTARSNSPNPEWNSMLASVRADGRVFDAGDPNRECKYVAARSGFGTRFSVLDVQVPGGETLCASITQPREGAMPMTFIAPNSYVADFAMRTPVDAEFTIYRGRADCSWIGDIWPTMNRIQVDGVDLMRCIPRTGQPAWRSMLIQLGNPARDGGHLVCPIVGPGCTPFAARLVPTAGQRLAGRVEWWPAMGDAQRVAVPPDGGVLFAPFGVCSVTVDPVQGLDRGRSRGFGSIFDDSPLCALESGGFGAAHDGACAR